MTKLGLHTFVVAPKWDVSLMQSLRDRFTDYRVKVLEIPLLDPDEINVQASSRFFQESEIEPTCSLALPSSLNMINDPESVLAFLRPACKVSQAVGSNILSGVTYGSIGYTSGLPVTDREFSATCRYLDKAAHLAKSYGLRLGIEPCNRYETHLINTASQARKICESVGAENLFIHLDTYHMNIEEVSFTAGFRDCGDFLGYVHLSESNRGTPSKGTVNWLEIFKSLVSIGFNGITTLESMNHVHPDIAAGLAVWRPVASNPDDVIDKGLPFLHSVAEEAGFAFE